MNSGSMALLFVVLLLSSTVVVADKYYSPVIFTAEFETSASQSWWFQNQPIVILSAQTNFPGPYQTRFIYSSTLSLLDRVNREDWLMEYSNAELRENFNMTSLSYTMETKAPATGVPIGPYTPTPAPPNSTAPPSVAMSQVFVISFSRYYRYSTPDSSRNQGYSFPMEFAFLQGPKPEDILRVLGQVLLSNVSLAQKRFSFLFSPAVYTEVGENFATAFRVTQLVGDNSVPTAEETVAMLNSSFVRNYLCESLEGCFQISMASNFPLPVSFTAWSKSQKDVHFSLKVRFFVAILVSFILIVGGIVAVWWKIKVIPPK